MPLVTTNEMLKKAQAGHYAVGAFNVENMEMVMAVIKAAEEMNSPVIMQTTPSTVKYAGLDYYLAMVRTAAERASVPVAIHLDHGSSFKVLRIVNFFYKGINPPTCGSLYVPYE